jgi:hypothetical protein
MRIVGAKALFATQILHRTFKAVTIPNDGVKSPNRALPLGGG